MTKVFRVFHPKQIARYVKSFHRGVFFIQQQGPFHFENGIVCYDELHGITGLQTVASINKEVKALRQCHS